MRMIHSKGKFNSVSGDFIKNKILVVSSFMYMFDVLQAFFKLPSLNYVFKHHVYAVRKLI